MDAPTFLPATVFEQPVEAPYELSTQTASIEELMTSPSAWAVVIKHAPFMGAVVQSPMAKPNLGNFTLDMFLSLGMIDQKTIDVIDLELGQLPRSEWPTE